MTARRRNRINALIRKFMARYRPAKIDYTNDFAALMRVDSELPRHNIFVERSEEKYAVSLGGLRLLMPFGHERQLLEAWSVAIADYLKDNKQPAKI